MPCGAAAYRSELLRLIPQPYYKGDRHKPLIHSQQPIDKGELPQQDDHQQRPDEPFAQSQATLTGSGEPELELGMTDRDNVAVLKKGMFHRLAVDHRQRLLRRYQFEAFAAA